MTHTGAPDSTRHYLRYELRVAREKACSTVMNALAPHCPPLYWGAADRVGTGMSGLAGTGDYCDAAAAGQAADYCDAAAAAAASQAWARQFELQPHPDPTPGTIRYDGEIHGLAVKVWAITDNDTFETSVRRMVAR